MGRPGRSVREAEQRARAALEASGEDRWPNNKVVANLAPGTYTFKCTIGGHGAMTGTITVQ